MTKEELHKLMDEMPLDQIKDILSYAGYLYRIRITAQVEGGIKIKDTNMNARAKHICSDCDVFTIEELSTYTAKEVLRWRNIGESTIKAMREEMQKHGFDFAINKP